MQGVREILPAVEPKGKGFLLAAMRIEVPRKGLSGKASRRIQDKAAGDNEKEI